MPWYLFIMTARVIFFLLVVLNLTKTNIAWQFAAWSCRRTVCLIAHNSFSIQVMFGVMEWFGAVQTVLQLPTACVFHLWRANVFSIRSHNCALHTSALWEQNFYFCSVTAEVVLVLCSAIFTSCLFTIAPSRILFLCSSVTCLVRSQICTTKLAWRRYCND